MTKTAIVGWIIEIFGTALWIYGYFAAGHPPLIDLQSKAPWWIADYLQNFESQLGMVLVFAAMVPMYWPAPRPQSAGHQNVNQAAGVDESIEE